MMTHHIKNNTQKNTLELQKKIYLALCLIKPVETDAFYTPLLRSLQGNLRQEQAPGWTCCK